MPNLKESDLAKPNIRQAILQQKQKKDPLTYEILQTIHQIDEEGGVFDLSAGNTGEDFFNYFALAHPDVVVVGASDNTKYNTMLVEMTAPSNFTYKPVKDELGSVVGVTFDDDPDMDVALTPAFAEAIKPFIGRKASELAMKPEQVRTIFSNSTNNNQSGANVPAANENTLVAVADLQALLPSVSTFKSLPNNAFISAG